MTVNVFIVDDDADFCDSLIWLLETADVAALAFHDADAFLQFYDGRPGCLLLDVRMPGMTGIALQQRLLDMDAPLSVIIVTGHANVPIAVRAMKQKAVDLLEKPFDDATLLTAIENGLALAHANHEALQRTAAARDGWMELTRRERQIFLFVVRGMANREIADKLKISIKTVEIHRSRVMTKMRADSLVDLVVKFGALDLAHEQNGD